MAGDLNNVSYVTLALIGDGGASPQDLVEMNRSGGQIYYAVAASRLYAEPKRLERLGYVSSEKRPGKTRERTFYTLTDRGREALRRWVLEPPALPRIQNEAVPKLLSGDILGDDEQLLASLLTLRDEIEEHQARLDEARKRLEGLPHRRSYLLLIQELGDRLLQVQREWLDDVERELGPRTPPGSQLLG
jgi:PadR family transcriptional regulator AphA